LENLEGKKLVKNKKLTGNKMAGNIKLDIINNIDMVRLILFFI